MSAKLTRAQVDLLDELARIGPQIVVVAYKPGATLVRLGLASADVDAWGHSQLLSITKLGRRILAPATIPNEGPP